jgi:hypothetical protein
LKAAGEGATWNIMKMFSEERRKHEKVVHSLKSENKKLKKFKAACEKEFTSKAKFQQNDSELVDRVVSQEITKYKKLLTMEKENIIRDYNEQLWRREKHIKMLSESVRVLEEENKHMLDIIYNKEKEYDGEHRQMDNVILNLRKDNKNLYNKLKALEQEYDNMSREKSLQITSLKEIISGFDKGSGNSLTTLDSVCGYKAKSQVRTSRVDYWLRRENYQHRDALYKVARDQNLLTSRTLQEPDQLALSERDKKVKRRLKNMNEIIKDLESKFLSTASEDNQQTLNFILNDNDDESSDGESQNSGITNKLSLDLVDLDCHFRNPTPDSVTQKDTPHQASGSESRTQYRSRAMYASPTPDENNLNSYLSNCNLDKGRWLWVNF